MVLMMANLRVHCLLFYLDNLLDESWFHLIEILIVLVMSYLRDKHWEYNLDLLMVMHLAFMKV